MTKARAQWQKTAENATTYRARSNEVRAASNITELSHRGEGTVKIEDTDGTALADEEERLSSDRILVNHDRSRTGRFIHIGVYERNLVDDRSINICNL